jgi:hypothetical protein
LQSDGVEGTFVFEEVEDNVECLTLKDHTSDLASIAISILFDKVFT